MNQSDGKPETENVRHKAAELRRMKSSKEVTKLSEAETLNLIHELQVRKIELELQNDELRHKWAIAEVAAHKYTKLYDFSPTGCLSFSTEGKITELNLYAAQLLGKERMHLQGSQFGFFVSNDTRGAFNRFLENLFNSKSNQTCEITLLPNGNPPVFVHLTGIAATIGEDCLVSLIDITERKLKEAEIQTILQTTMDGFYLVDMDGRFLDTNESYCKMIGYTRDEILRMGVKDIEVIDTEEIIKSRIQRILKNGYERFETKHRRKDGKVIEIEASVNLLVKEKPELFCFMRDISERKQVEAALQTSEEKFRALFETATDGIFQLTEDGSIRALNQAFARMHGYTVEEILMMHLKDLDTPETHLLAPERMKRILSGESMTFEVEHFCKDGQTIPIEVSTNMVTVGGWKYVLGFHRDITERKRASEKLKKSEDRYRKAQELGHVGSWEYDIKNDDFWGSEEGKRIYGFNPETDVFSAEEVMKCVIESNRVNQAMADLIEKNLPYNIVFDIIPRNSSEKRTIHSIADLVKDKKGHPIIVTGVLHDITDQKKAEEEIKRKNQELHFLNAEKDKFFSIIAHDLRSPFTSFLGFTQIMVEELDTMTLKDIQKIAVSMRTSATNLFSLLENLLEWSRLQRGITTFNPVLFLLKKTISENIPLVVESAKKKNINISYDVPEEILVNADHNMFCGILRNLTSNAVKFTPKGGSITIAAKPIPDEWVEISVMDMGIGMSKDLVDNLFNLEVDTSRRGTENEPSTGLGLIICKEFVEKHNGKLWVESEQGKGSKFHFTLSFNKG